MSSTLRVAVVSHAHPELSSGGAQEASYWLFQHLKGRRGVEPVFVARCAPQALGHAGSFALFRCRQNEILWSPPNADRFRLITGAPAVLRRQAAELCERVRPDIIHLHHYVGFGTDLIRIFRQELGIPIVLTLSEYLAICHRDGQMLKTSGRLCYTASHSECSLCFPEIASGKFFLRKALIIENFSYVDLFIAPSEFLASRYVEWGIPQERIRIIESPVPDRDLKGARHTEQQSSSSTDRSSKRIAYFGRLSPYKGVDVLLSAVGMLDDAEREKMTVLLFGFSLDHGGSEIERRVASQVDELKGCASVRGEYRNEDVIDLMRSVDWIVVPSIWWESYSFVIHEAKAAGVPILCSNIGLMREKVRPGIDGVHFMVGDSSDLAEKLRAICAGELKVDLPAPHLPPPTTAEIIDAYRAAIPGCRWGEARPVGGCEPAIQPDAQTRIS